MLPLMPFSLNSVPWHSNQYVSLPEVYIQSASLEIAWSRTVLELGSIAGEVIIPFITSGVEGFDINEPEDIVLMENYINNGEAVLPNINLTFFATNKDSS